MLGPREGIKKCARPLWAQLGHLQKVSPDDGGDDSQSWSLVVPKCFLCAKACVSWGHLEEVECGEHM
jgi:hypothetical protein